LKIKGDLIVSFFGLILIAAAIFFGLNEVGCEIRKGLIAAAKIKSGSVDE